MKKIVVNGCFDLIHVGHLKLLKHARSYPDSYVLVLIDSDQRIRKNKGISRPFNNEYERLLLLQSLKYVDRVEIFDSDQELDYLIKQYQPDLMIKGSDYLNKEIIGINHCKEIEFYDRIQEYSTTKKIQDFISR